MNPAHREEVGRRKLAAQPDFQFFSWEAMGDGVLMQGCVPSVYLRGPRKGRPKYDPPHQRVFVSDAEEAAERVRYEAETGKCGACMGDGKEFARWDHLEGTTWRECRVCKGDGLLAVAS